MDNKNIPISNALWTLFFFFFLFLWFTVCRMNCNCAIFSNITKSSHSSKLCKVICTFISFVKHLPSTSFLLFFFNFCWFFLFIYNFSIQSFFDLKSFMEGNYFSEGKAFRFLPGSLIASICLASCSLIVFFCFSNAFPKGEYVNLNCS